MDNASPLLQQAAIVAAINAEMDAKGISQSELERRTSIPQATISRKLAAQRGDLTLPEFFLIAAAVQVFPEDLLAQASA